MTTTFTPTYGAYASTVPFGAFTALNGLASDTNLLAGWATAAQDNTADNFNDVEISGSYKTSTTVTANRVIETWVYAGLDDTPTYPDTITGSVGTFTLSSKEVKASGALALLGRVIINSTNNIVYPFHYTLLTSGFGFVPKRWGLFITQSSAAALNASSNNINRSGFIWTGV